VFRILWLIPLLTCACSRETDDRVAADAPARSIQVAAENLVRVEAGELIAGPLLSGEIQPAHSATVRAEVGGEIEALRIEEGQRVQHRETLGRIEARILEDLRRSAQSAVRSAEASLELARVELWRNEELVAAGAIARRSLDQARANVAAADSQLANARANLANLEEQLGDAILRAPLTGLVSRRFASSGDVVTAGAELFTVIDPSSMRLEGAVPSSYVSELRPGHRVQFTISGYDDPVEGRIERITPEADPATRQVTVFVTIPNRSMRLVAGLFAEGRVVLKSGKGLIVPINAVSTENGDSWVMRVRDGRAERVKVTIGLSDPLTERVLLQSGVAPGDVLLRGAAQAITPGSPVDVGE
jgi:RND family efflux transporter MFP subunit